MIAAAYTQEHTHTLMMTSCLPTLILFAITLNCFLANAAAVKVKGSAGFVEKNTQVQRSSCFVHFCFLIIMFPILPNRRSVDMEPNRRRRSLIHQHESRNSPEHAKGPRSERRHRRGTFFCLCLPIVCLFVVFFWVVVFVFHPDACAIGL